MRGIGAFGFAVFLLGFTTSRVLAVIGAGLGIVGLVAVLKDVPWPVSVWQDVAWGIGAFGFAVFLLGFMPLFLRAKN